jgi:hypothetical protein
MGRNHILGAFAELRRASVSFVISLCQKVKTRLPLDGVSVKFDI